MFFFLAKSQGHLLTLRNCCPLYHLLKGPRPRKIHRLQFHIGYNVDKLIKWSGGGVAGGREELFGSHIASSNHLNYHRPPSGQCLASVNSGPLLPPSGGSIPQTLLCSGSFVIALCSRARPILIFECRCRLFSEKNYDYDLIGRLKKKKAYKT